MIIFSPMEENLSILIMIKHPKRKHFNLQFVLDNFFGLHRYKNKFILTSCNSSGIGLSGDGLGGAASFNLSGINGCL